MDPAASPDNEIPRLSPAPPEACRPWSVVVGRGHPNKNEEKTGEPHRTWIIKQKKRTAPHSTAEYISWQSIEEQNRRYGAD